MPDRETALRALDAIVDPATGRGLVQAGRVKGLVVAEDRAGFALEAPADRVADYAAVRDAAEAALAALPGVVRTNVVLTAEVADPAAAPARPRQAKASLSPQAVEQGRARAPVPTARPAHVRRVIAVASGKGGVGKSTVAVNLACALALRGLSVGLLDADVHGPSVPIMLGIAGKPDYVEGAMVPARAHGVAAMSTGLLTGADEAMVWRGPMASQALTQMLMQTRWGTVEAPLDVLVVDLPPGTGDVHLSLIQKTVLDGVVVVSTPQAVALADARRAHALFQRVGAPILGLVETMGGEVFGSGGAAGEADRLSVPLLGELPLDPAVRRGGDAGRPVVIDDPDGAAGQAMRIVAERVAKALFSG